MTVINGATGEVETTIPNTTANTGDAVTSVAVDDVTNTLYAGDDSAQKEPSGRVTAFDGNDNYAFLGQVPVGRCPTQVGLIPRPDRSWRATLRMVPLACCRTARQHRPIDWPISPPDSVFLMTTMFSSAACIVTDRRLNERGPGTRHRTFVDDARGAGALADPFLPTAQRRDHNRDERRLEDRRARPESAGCDRGDTLFRRPIDLESAVLMNLAPGSYTAVCMASMAAPELG